MIADYSVHYKRFHDESEAHAVAMAEWLGVYLKGDLPKDRSTPALDIGCGFGFALRALRNAGFSNVRGLEVSSHQATIARRGGFEVSVVSDTIDFLKRHSGHFGIVLLLDVLEHIPVPEQLDMMRTIRETLSPGGRVIVTVPNANSPLAARWRYIDFTHSSSFTEHSLYFVLSNAGFSDIQMDNEKGIGALPKRLWQTEQRRALKKWLVRYLWRQVFEAELHPSESLNDICFELNLKATAFNGTKPSVSDNLLVQL